MHSPLRFWLARLWLLAALGAAPASAQTPAPAADSGAPAKPGESLLGEAVEADSAAAFYEKALIAFNLGDSREAYIYLKNALKEDPLLLPAHLLLGRLFLNLGQGEEAQRQLLIADGLGAHRSLIQNSLARAYLMQGRPQQVIDEMFPIGTAREEDAELLALRGEAHLDLDQVFDAQRAFTQAWEKNPRSVAAILGRVRVMLLQNEIEQASALVREAVEVAPTNPRAWYLKGLLANALGDILGALGDYERSTQLLPAFLPAQIGRITVLLRLNRLEPAAAVVAEVRKLYPNDPRSSYLSAVVQTRRGDAKGAEAALREANDLIARMPRELVEAHAPTLLLAGMVSFNLKQWEQATDYLDLYLAKDDDAVGARVLLARIELEQRDQPERAIQLLEAAVALAPDNAEALSLLAEAYMRASAHLKAAAVLRQALASKRNDVVLRTQRAVNDFGLGRRGTAIEELATLVDERPEANNAGATLVVMLMQQRRFADAATKARALLLKDPANLTYANLFGSALLANDELKHAEWAFDYALVLDPSFFPARLNLAELLLRRGQLPLARGHLEMIVEAEPRESAPLLLLARTWESGNDLKTALEFAERAAAADADALDVAIYRTELLLKLHRPEDAVRVAEAIETRSGSTEDAELLAAMSRAYIAAGQRATAQVVLRRASSLAGYDARQLLTVAGLQREAGDPEAAIWSLRKAVEGEPEYLPTHMRLAEYLIEAGRIVDASAEAETLAGQFPQAPYADHVRGLIARHQGDLPGALAAFRAAQAKEPSSLLALRVFETQRDAEGLEPAMAFLADWIDQHPDDGLAAATLGQAYQGLGRSEEARALLERALAQAPDNALLLNNLAMVSADLDAPQALDYARRAYQLLPSAAEIGDTLGWILVRRGELDEGLRYLRDAQSRAGSDDPGISYHIGYALNALGRTAEAIGELEQAAGSEAQAGQEPDRKRIDRLLKELRARGNG